MIPPVSYILQATSSHELTGNIITYAHFEEGILGDNEHNYKEYESIFALIDESYTYEFYDDGYISTIAPEEIRDRSQIHP